MQRISAYDRITNAVRQIVPDVMNTAAAMDAELEMYIANGTILPYLFCVPILVKDNYDATDGKLDVLCVLPHSSAAAIAINVVQATCFLDLMCM